MPRPPSATPTSARARRAAAAAGAFVPLSLRAHELGGLAAPGWSSWSSDLQLWLMWSLPGLLVLLGIARLWRRAGRGAGVSMRQALCYLAGWLALGLALVSPLQPWGAQLLWVHMAQHELMMMVAAPLLVLGRPLGPLVWGLPARWRGGAARGVRALGLQWAMRVLTRPLNAWWLFALVLWTWHTPQLFEAALVRPRVHLAQHVSFLLAALCFWWSVLESHEAKRHKGAAALSLFTTLVHSCALAALITFAAQPWYAHYLETTPRWGLDPALDQHLGGLVLWLVQGTALLAGTVAGTSAWLQEAQGFGARRWGGAK